MASKWEVLSDKHKIFVLEYLIDLNATEAAKRTGYSEVSAKNQGCELMKRQDIREAIQERMDLRAKKTGISAEKVLQRLEDRADLDIADAFGSDGRLLPVKEMPLHIRKSIVSLKVYEDFIEGTKVGEIKDFKVSDRTKCDELIGKHLKLFGEDKVVINNVTALSDEEIDAKLAKYTSKHE